MDAFQRGATRTGAIDDTTQPAVADALIKIHNLFTVYFVRLLVSICNLVGASAVKSHGNVDPGSGPLVGL